MLINFDQFNIETITKTKYLPLSCLQRSLLSVKEDDSEGYFLWSLQFFMEFNRLSSHGEVYRSEIIR